ncbi:transposase [Aliarcobacter cryaerophilus]|uniref:Transposase n=1 Tax=Aliarcobacter cryaerophilus TaxID=28198 RepID=A0A7G9LRG5_9BACT|nr:transposase [Aliarcobacter cryaerophilus]
MNYFIKPNIGCLFEKVKWEEENKDKIKLFYLPPYSPEFNPDEYLNQDYKSNVHKNGLPKTRKN